MTSGGRRARWLAAVESGYELQSGTEALGPDDAEAALRELVTRYGERYPRRRRDLLGWPILVIRRPPWPHTAPVNDVRR